MKTTKTDYRHPQVEVSPLLLKDTLLTDSFGSDGVEGFDDIEQEW